MSSYYIQDSFIPNIEQNLSETVKLFPKLNFDQINTILDYSNPSIKDGYVAGGVTMTDLIIDGKDYSAVMTMELRQQLQDYLDNGGATDDQLGKFTGGTQNNEKPTNTTVRWPNDVIHDDTDYVFFQFGKYQPPFAKDVTELRKRVGYEDYLPSKDNPLGLQKEGVGNKFVEEQNDAATYTMYRASEQLELKPYNIMLPMPQDLSNELQAQWQGKQFTATGRAATAALGAGNFSFANEVVKNIAGNAKALQTALNTAVLNSIPGVGGNLSFNDVSGSTRGIVINPNAELLYDSPEMREIGMIFKLVAQNEQEAKDIRKICKIFRASSLPRWGGAGLEEGIFDGEASIVGSNRGRSWNNWWGERKPENRNIDGKFDISTEDNWIRVPDLCKFTFMKGNGPHPYLAQFKPCAIQAVEVNYTPDGTYTTCLLYTSDAADE